MIKPHTQAHAHAHKIQTYERECASCAYAIHVSMFTFSASCYSNYGILYFISNRNALSSEFINLWMSCDADKFNGLKKMGSV